MSRFTRAAGVADKLIFGWLGNPGVGSLHAIRRAVEKATPRSLELEEYSHFGMISRYVAGAAKLPFLPLRNYHNHDENGGMGINAALIQDFGGTTWTDVLVYDSTIRLECINNRKNGKSEVTRCDFEDIAISAR